MQNAPSHRDGALPFSPLLRDLRGGDDVVACRGGGTGARWLRETLAEGPELGDVHRRQLMEPLREVLHRLVEPLPLVLRVAPNYATADDVLEQLIARLILRRRFVMWLAVLMSTLVHLVKKNVEWTVSET